MASSTVATMTSTKRYEENSTQIQKEQVLEPRSQSETSMTQIQGLQKILKGLKGRLDDISRTGTPNLPQPPQSLTVRDKMIQGVRDGENGTNIPSFYDRVPKTSEEPTMILKSRVKRDARELAVFAKSADLLEHDELTELYRSLEQHASPPFDDEEKFLTYQDYLKAIADRGEKFQNILKASTFLKLTSDKYARVSITTLFNYIMRKTWQKQTRLSLLVHDETGQGFLLEPNLETYISDLLPTLTQLKDMEETFVPFYVCSVVRKFFFFLDPNRTGRVRITDIMISGFIDELLDLREEDSARIQENWFSFDTSMKAYGHYLNLDTDHNGMLSNLELLKFCSSDMTLTKVFVDRLFQTVQTFDGEIDYRTFLDFVMAVEHRTEPQSIQYFFRILDIDQRGYLDVSTINYFYKSILELMVVHGTERIKFQDVADEIFDMVSPKDPTKITLKDLIDSGSGPVVVMMLIDFQGFWSHENREFSPDMKATGSTTV